LILQEKKIFLFFCHLKYTPNFIMAEQNDPALAEVMALLETEPTNAPEPAPGHDIPALKEQLAIFS